jgi:hypothetical protein
MTALWDGVAQAPADSVMPPIGEIAIAPIASNF